MSDLESGKFAAPPFQRCRTSRRREPMRIAAGPCSHGTKPRDSGGDSPAPLPAQPGLGWGLAVPSPGPAGPALPLGSKRRSAPASPGGWERPPARSGGGRGRGGGGSPVPPGSLSPACWALPARPPPPAGRQRRCAAPADGTGPDRTVGRAGQRGRPGKGLGRAAARRGWTAAAGDEAARGWRRGAAGARRGGAPPGPGAWRRRGASPRCRRCPTTGAAAPSPPATSRTPSGSTARTVASSCASTPTAGWTASGRRATLTVSVPLGRGRGRGPAAPPPRVAGLPRGAGASAAVPPC